MSNVLGNLKYEFIRVAWPTARETLITATFVVCLGIVGGAVLCLIDSLLALLSQQALNRL